MFPKAQLACGKVVGVEGPKGPTPKGNVQGSDSLMCVLHRYGVVWEELQLTILQAGHG